ncbi:hemerythrin domain-containing protein [Fundidesulfovibrio terrae]|uniref:hemerythrin domain-containing protein n=1 Tax=Fundidesulfovibrio terrae TaxID=2922866 RepID=UPI001FAFCE00|nr:hemerythrin domain-containing protein [Fundidesulfovibrio terrae]
MENRWIDRRSALRLGLCAGAGLLPLGVAANARAAKKPGKKNEEVSATEDLMREHGALVRLLLIYRESANRLKAGGDLRVKALEQAAGIIRRFVEGYHEKIEERFVFPRFEKSPDLGELVRVLKVQHDMGRKVTDRILALVKTDLGADGRTEAAQLIASFERMYYPHLAWEDTILFPAYHASMSEKEFDKMGDRFEDMEHETLGAGGFESTLADIAGLEKELGIYDISRFTPRE